MGITDNLRSMRFQPSEHVEHKKTIDGILQQPCASLQAYYDFWSLMDSPENASHFFANLLNIASSEPRGMRLHRNCQTQA